MSEEEERMSKVRLHWKLVAYREWKELGVQLELLAEMVQTQSERGYALQKTLKELIKEQSETHTLLFIQADKLRDRFNIKSEQLEALIGDDWDRVSEMPIDSSGEELLSCAMKEEQ